MSEWLIERLDRSHDRTTFDCGKATLNDFLRTMAGQYEKRNLGRTYVATQPEDRHVAGYYTVASGSIAFEAIPATASKKLPRHPVPVILLARLAVDRTMQGRGLGETLLFDALTRCLAQSSVVGLHAVEVGAIDVSARAFYERYGFVPLVDSPLHLYLPITTIRPGAGNRADSD